ncbi:hypothetical protein DFH11DRAFT_1512923 [Phellopilus nigrolimitatus]|nr:hypothetical protein DFH11DRAFT_1522025 [Phellopilus nigrolimitatus]KAH8111546.1 hypothetical protein DFH11DRAFT_1512923 [Phellopilus nigrolimitatus]
MWFPRIARLFTLAQLRLHIVDGLVSQHFPDLQFSAMSLNLGAKTVCNWHRDFKNLVWGVCAVGAFGRFNHRTSGQLLLREAKVIMEVKRGDVIYIPSGSLTHCNAPLRAGEERRSIACYTAGGLIRWVAQGHQQATGKSHMTKAEFKKYEMEGAQRWEDGWQLFCTLNELQAS